MRTSHHHQFPVRTLLGSLAMMACLGLSTFAQQPTASPPTPTGPQPTLMFQRLDDRTEADLEKLLSQVRELDLAKDCKEQLATIQGELRAQRTFRSAGVGKPAPAGEEPPEFLARTHREAIAALGLPGRADGDCQLKQNEAKHLERWSAKLRELEMVSIPVRNGQMTAPKAANMPASLLEVKSRLKLTDAAPALAQMLQAEAEPSRRQLIDLLKPHDQPAAIAALARLAVFDPALAVRGQAVAALKTHPAEKYRPVLLEALRYPWPPAANHAAETLVALGDTGAVPQLRALLDAPDPSAPFVPPGTETKPQVRELVRLNHLRNCLLCHPASTSSNDLVRGFVPTPGQQLTPVYYGERSGDGPFVRADITYLRQDFSLVMPVEKAAPWPDRQRFDFLVRTRDATPQELEEARKTPPEKQTYPQREAVRFALKELGK